MTAYVLCGALAGLAGALYPARFGNVDSATGNGYELTVVSAVVVGGVAFTGGAGTVYGAALGAVPLTSINSVLPAIGVSSVWVTAMNGILLLLAGPSTTARTPTRRPSTCWRPARTATSMAPPPSASSGPTFARVRSSASTPPPPNAWASRSAWRT